MRERIKLGRLTRIVIENAQWLGEDEWPSDQLWADEAEQAFQHLECHDMFGSFLPRLRGNLNQRNGAFAEARAAFWFRRNGFKITHWEPQVTNQPGDLEVRWPATTPIFVEVKQRTWQAELSQDERLGGRKDEPRYKNAEFRWLDQDEQVLCGAHKARPKFAPDRPNLVVIAEHMFRSPVDGCDPEYVARTIAKPGFDPVGAILCLDAVLMCAENVVRYRTLFIENPRAAGTAWEIPASVAEGLRQANA